MNIAGKLMKSFEIVSNPIMSSILHQFLPEKLNIGFATTSILLEDGLLKTGTDKISRCHQYF